LVEDQRSTLFSYFSLNQFIDEEMAVQKTEASVIKKCI